MALLADVPGTHERTHNLPCLAKHKSPQGMSGVLQLLLLLPLPLHAFPLLLDLYAIVTVLLAYVCETG